MKLFAALSGFAMLITAIGLRAEQLEQPIHSNSYVWAEIEFLINRNSDAPDSGPAVLEKAAACVTATYDRRHLHEIEIKSLVGQFRTIDDKSAIVWFHALSPFLFPTRDQIKEEEFQKTARRFQYEAIVLLKSDPSLAT